MSNFQKFSLLGLRLSLGWLMFYAGITKVFNPDWSAAGFLANASTFPDFYSWFARPEILPYTNFLNQWGLTIIGVMLLLGIGVRLASFLGIALMALYYFPALNFPYVGQSYIIDTHFIYSFGFLVLAAFSANQIWSVGQWLANLPLTRKSPILQKILK